MPTHIRLSLLQDLVSKNEALRHQLHQLQVHTEQQLRKKDAAAQAEEERRSQLYQKAMDEAKQRIAEHVVCFNQAMCFFWRICTVCVWQWSFRPSNRLVSSMLLINKQVVYAGSSACVQCVPEVTSFNCEFIACCMQASRQHMMQQRDAAQQAARSAAETQSLAHQQVNGMHAEVESASHIPIGFTSQLSSKQQKKFQCTSCSTIQ